VLTIRGKKVRKAKYAKDKPEARVHHRQLETLEEATRYGLARPEDIEEWVERKWINVEEAEAAFNGFSAHSLAQQHSTQVGQTDYQKLWQAFEDQAWQATSGSGGARRNYQNSQAHGRVDYHWLASNFPDLRTITLPDVEHFQAELNRQFAPWTVFHRMTKLRQLLDQAVRWGMLKENPARTIRLGQPKRVKPPRILAPDEVTWMLDTSLVYRQWLSGGIPTCVRLALYAGLRPIEMVWAKWEWLNWDRRTLAVQETHHNHQRWVPKDYECRVLDIKTSCMEYLKEERQRQEGQDLLGTYLLPSGSANLPHLRGRPLDQSSPQKALDKMLTAEKKKDTDITLYTLRHTYATSLLRPKPEGAGFSPVDVQERLGHADLSTTQQYLVWCKNLVQTPFQSKLNYALVGLRSIDGLFDLSPIMD
jgi:site-specific recombinase XerD